MWDKNTDMPKWSTSVLVGYLSKFSCFTVVTLLRAGSSFRPGGSVLPSTKYSSLWWYLQEKILKGLKSLLFAYPLSYCLQKSLNCLLFMHGLKSSMPTTTLIDTDL